MISFQPTAPHVGRLILPRPEERTPDGRVWIQMAEKEKPVPLVWENSAELGANQDVFFSSKTEQAKSGGNCIPERLKDWRSVSPLESLAGARAQDSLLVSLPSPTWDGKRYVIQAAPTEVSASEKAPVQVLAAEGKRMLVSEWGPEKSEPVWLNTEARLEKTDLQRFVGQKVWIYAQPQTNGEKLVTALRPQEVLHFSADQTHTGLKNCERALNHLWDSLPNTMNESHRVLLQPMGAKPAFQVGQDLLALHLFGSYQGPGGDASPVVGGHFAYGKARLNSEKDFDLSYHQVYGHNPNDIVAGKVSWDAYTGGLDQGWMYTRPVTDMLIDHPALQRTYDFGGGMKFNFFQTMEVELERMEARYRVGDGDGIAVVTPRTNCSQDSANALFAVTQRILELDRTVAVYPGESQYKDFRELVAIAEDLQKIYAPWGAPATWAANAQRLPIPVPGPVSRVLQVLSTYQTVLPRDHQERVAQVMLRHGAQIFIQQTNCVGAAPVVETPHSPNRLPSLPVWPG